MIAPAKTKITTPFGWVAGYPINKNYDYPGKPSKGDYGFHTGVDFSHSPDSKIYAPQDGTITYINLNEADTGGIYIILESGSYRHYFGHIKRDGVRVEVGDKVKQGQHIADMGNTGYALGVHLHWTLRVNGELVNPLEHISKEEDMRLSKREADLLLKIGYMNTPDKKAIENVTKYPAIDSLDYIWNSKRFNDNKWIVLKGYPALKKEHAKLTTALRAQRGDTSEFNALGKALASLLNAMGYKKG